MTNDKKNDEKQPLCCDSECAPPYGDVEDCEFYQDGRCLGAVNCDKVVCALMSES